MERRILKIVAISVFFPLFRLRRKVSRAKGNPSLQILEYSTPRPKFKIQIWISNSVGEKFPFRHLRINSFWSQLGYLLELSLWHLGITSLWRQLWSSLVLEIPRDSFLGIPLCFPPLGFTMFHFCGELHINLLGFYYASSFLGNYINNQKENISYVPLDPVSDYVYIADLNNRLRVGWKTLPNLNLKLKFQTQTWISKLKSSPSSRVVRDSGKFTPMVKGMKPYCHVSAQSIWAVVWYLPPWRSF